MSSLFFYDKLIIKGAERDMTNGKLGNAIREARINNNMSQEQLAELAGITPTHMKHIESEHRKPSVDVLFRITKILHLSLDNIIFGRDEHSCEYHYAENMLAECSSDELKLIIDIIKAVRSNMHDR